MHALDRPIRIARTRIAPRELQILAYRQRTEDPAAARDIRDARPRDPMWRPAGDLLAGQRDAPAAGRGEAGDAAHRGRLAGSVSAQQGDDFGLTHSQCDVLQDVTVAVVGVDVREREPHASPPRYTSTTRSSSCTCSGAPSATTRP